MKEKSTVLHQATGDDIPSDAQIISTQVPSGGASAPEIRKSSEDGTTILLSFSGFIVLFLVGYLFSRKQIQARFRYFDRFRLASCSRCRFYNSNPHLKCAVHPSNVHKIKAIDCPDFWPKNQDKFPK